MIETHVEGVRKAAMLPFLSVLPATVVLTNG
jgi:hypothetical protein